MCGQIKRYPCTALVLLAVLAGCVAPRSERANQAAVAQSSPQNTPSPMATASVATTTPYQTAVVLQPKESAAAIPVSYQPPATTPTVTPHPAQQQVEDWQSSALLLPTRDPADELFCDVRELSAERLAAEVQRRNPSLQAASAAWRAATERYPQAVSLEDPMIKAMIGPKAVGADGAGSGWMVEASQKIPWAGKRALRGAAADADADVMKGDIGDIRLRLTEAAKTALFDYDLARREADLNASTQRLVAQFREIAWNKYQVNQTTEQDVLQADVELASIEQRQTELARDEQVAVARINTLLHREADHPLPPPTSTLPAPLPAVDSLQQTAAQSRPDLFALQSRIRAEQANLALACKEYYPDLNLVAKYDGFMADEMRPQVGMEFNVPLQCDRRSAAVREASERLRQRRAEYQDRLDQVRFEVQSAFARAAQSRQSIHLYEERILPAARRSVESAQANYASGRLDFLRLIDAERQVYAQQAMYYQAVAEYHQRLAELERVVGGSLPETVLFMPVPHE